MSQSFKRHISLLIYIIAGESIFLLPFVLARIFRPTLLKVFSVTNTELGAAQSIYGIIAVVAYFFGGMITDRFSPRKLMTIALILTGIIGFYLLAFPGYFELNIIYGLWGITTILLFWSPLIKSTRVWTNSNRQGLAFGLLDGGRGLIAALIGVAGIWLFESYFPESNDISAEERKKAFSTVIILFSTMTIAAGVLVWFGSSRVKIENPTKLKSGRIGQIVKMPTVWLQAIIIICAYCGYKVTDDVTLYAKEGLGYNEMQATKTGQIYLWARPLVAVLAGFLADKLRRVRIINISFILIIIGCVFLSLNLKEVYSYVQFLFIVVAISTGVFALRSVYFAIMPEASIPIQYTGLAVGIVSTLGYLPDVFMGPLMGYFLDNYPGVNGHRYIFMFVGCMSFLGLLASMAFSKFTKIKFKNSQVSKSS